MTDEMLVNFKFLPMLANKFLECKRRVIYPCYVQPKLDGIRYTARRLSSGQVILKTRSDTACPFFDHIKNSLQALPIPPNMLLDGEFYSLTVPFRTLNGYCNRKKLEGKTGFGSIPKEELESVHYYLFDCYFIDQPQMPFAERYKALQDLLSHNRQPYLNLVPAYVVNKEEEIEGYHQRFVEEGFEGVIIRNAQSPYKLKDRSNDLLKYKHFFDEEFEIVGANAPSNGKEEGCIIWELKVPNSDLRFTCRPRAPYDARQSDWIEYCQDPSQMIGQKYTVRFQEKYENGVPRFPTGVAIRHDL